jgi:hypothetical protein
MSSSTSSSEAGLVAASRVVLRAAGPALLVGAVVLGLLHVVARPLPAPAPRDLEGVIVSTQIARARAMKSARLLLVGDSSALMGIDAAALGPGVESLATIGYVGPAGFAHLARQVEAPSVVVILHGASLSVPEATFAKRGFERLVLGETRPVRFRDAIFERLFAPALDLPLPGRYGARYGRPDRLAAALETGHGTVVDPNHFTPDRTPPFRFVLAPEVATRLDVLAEALAGRRVWFALAPLPASRVDAETLATHDAVAAEVARRLRARLLPLPVSLPDDRFATATHLDARGRAELTALLARLL